MGHEFEALSGKILEAAVAVHKASCRPALELQLPNAGRQTCGPLIYEHLLFRIFVFRAFVILIGYPTLEAGECFFHSL